MRPGNSSKLFTAYALDTLVGEPPPLWHPVCWMGKLVGLADWGMPGRESGPTTERLSGTFIAVVLPLGTYWAARRFLRMVPGPLRGTAEMALLSAALAGRSLYDAAGDVQRGLASGIDEGRAQVARMVGRDTADLDEPEVTRAAIESVAENANDGVIAPMFYALIGGAPLALTYKMINTLDSMIGYRNLRYGDFGWASAKLDDAAGFIPARITAVAVAAASPVVGGSPVGAIEAWKNDAPRHASPNAGVCESTFAGALGVQLGGTNYYSDIAQEGPVMGEGLRRPEWDDINRAANLMYSAATLVLMVGSILRWFIRRRHERKD
jgi:adenosylcobinamide-phosphate synthase